MTTDEQNSVNQQSVRASGVGSRRYLAWAGAAVIVLGATAGASLFGSSFRVGEMRGRRIDTPDLPCEWVVATIHPSAVLRAGDRSEALDALVSDLQVAADAMAA